MGINSKERNRRKHFKIINSIYWGTFNSYTQQGHMRSMDIKETTISSPLWSTPQYSQGLANSVEKKQDMSVDTGETEPPLSLSL